MLIKLLKTIKRNTILTWVLSYMIIMALPLICNGIIYERAKNTIESELIVNSTQAMDKFKISVDNIIVNTSSIARTLQSDDNISRLCGLSEWTPYGEYSGSALSASRKLQNSLSVNQPVSDIYIFYKNIDLVTSSRHMYNKNVFYNQNFNGYGMSYEEWVAMFDENCYAVPRLVSHGGKNMIDMYYQIPEFLDRFDAMAVLSIDTQTLLDDAKMVTDLYSDVGIFILSKDNEVIMTNGVVDSIPENTKDSTVISTVSDTTGWKYVSVIPSDVFDKRLTYFKLINIFNIFICLVFCGVLSFFFAKKNARPLSLMKLIYNDEDEADTTLINNVLDDYRSAKQTRSELEQSHLMEELIISGGDDVLQELKKHKIDFPYQYYCVILFKLVNVSMLFGDENDISSVERYDSVKLIIKNVLEEIINEKHYANICKINGQIVAVVNINSEYILDFHNDLEEMLNRGKEFINSRFAFSYTPFVGGIHDVKTLHKSYSEAINALQYRTFISTSDIVFCDDANSDGSTSEVATIIPIEKSKQLINLLQLGDAQTTLSMINSLLQSAPYDSPTKYRVFLFDLISTLIRAVESTENDEIEVKISEELCELVENFDPSVVPEKINEIITEFCRIRAEKNSITEVDETEETISKKDILLEIKRFISENYTNQSLNIATIGEYFNITPYYVSNIFKKSENISMLDYISAIRIEKAKELLETTDLNLEAVALRCGFSNIRTFMRVFQKFEIITPGKYKELNKK